MRPFDLAKQANGRRFKNGIPAKYKCLLCVHPYGIYHTHDHRLEDEVKVSFNSYLESQIEILANDFHQSITIEKLFPQVQMFFTMNEPITLTKLKNSTDISKWYGILEEALNYYNSTAKAFPMCWDLADDHGPSCLVSCTMIADVPTDTREYCIRYVQVAIPKSELTTVIPIMAESKSDTECVYRRIVDMIPDKPRNSKVPKSQMEDTSSQDEEYDFIGTLNDLITPSPKENARKALEKV